MMKTIFRKVAMIAVAALAVVPMSATAEGETPIQITSEGGASIDTESNTLTYREKVVFHHADQQLIVTCDRLEIVRAESKPPVEGEEPDESEGQDQIKTAIAIGNVVITKIDEGGNKKIGKCGRAVFDAKTGNVTMTKSPSLLERKNLITAVQPSTVFILKENGEHQFKGPIKTQFVGSGGDDE